MPPVQDSATILVADDDPVIRGNLRLLLESEGYRAVEARDGTEAAKALEDSSIALVLLDLKMPGCNGLDVLRDHQDRLEETPVIVITALGGSGAAIEAMKLGAYDYITKPFDLDEVLFTVRRALAQTVLVAQVRALTKDEEEKPKERPKMKPFIGEEIPEHIPEEVVRLPRMINLRRALGHTSGASIRLRPSRRAGRPSSLCGESGFRTIR